MRATDNPDLGPLLRDRLRALLGGRGRPRLAPVRRIIAIALVLIAGVLALRPVAAPRATSPPVPTVTVVTATHDLASGATLRPGDLAVRRIPDGLRPSGALGSAHAAIGRLVAGPVRTGEPITDVRLIGPADTALSTGRADTTAVPVRLSDAGVAGLLHPGSRVEVVTLDPDQQGAPVLADDATVLAVPAAPASPDGSGARGRLVVLAVPNQIATRVAASSLRQPVTVTLR